MIEVIITLVPSYAPANREVIGKVLICNNGEGTTEVGNYDVTLYKAAKEIWKKGKVKGFSRKKGPYDLLYLALQACLKGR